VSRGIDLDLAAPSIVATRALAAPVLVAVLGAGVVGMAGAVSLRSRRRLVMPAGLIGAAAVAVSLAVGRVEGFGQLSAAGIAALVLGVAGRLLALRLGAPALVLVVPGSYGLLPGLAIFRGLYEMVNGSGPSAGSLSLQGGITTLLGAMAVLLAIAAGSVLGELLASPFDHRMVQKRRARRR
jgi:uncharacterized membrane protein YjjB (DUF3815 family)